MTVSKKDIQILIGFTGVLIAFVVFWFVFRPLTAKTNELKTENAELEIRVSELQDMMDKSEYYQSETARMNAEVNDVFTEFPANYMTEDAIEFSITEEMIAPLEINSVGMEVPQMTYQVTASQNSIMPDDQPLNVQLFDMPVTISYKASYEAFKRSINSICSNEKRMTIDNINAAFDSETGLLTGSMKVNMYYLTGTGVPYMAPEFSNIPVGTDNLFGTVALPSDTQTGESEETEEETSNE